MTQNPALCNLGHDTIDKTKLLTSSGVIVRDPVGNKYMTAASHGFPHGPAFFHPSGKERMISNIVMGLTHKCWDSPVAWWCWIRERNFWGCSWWSTCHVSCLFLFSVLLKWLSCFWPSIFLICIDIWWTWMCISWTGLIMYTEDHYSGTGKSGNA